MLSSALRATATREATRDLHQAARRAAWLTCPQTRRAAAWAAAAQVTPARDAWRGEAREHHLPRSSHWTRQRRVPQCLSRRQRRLRSRQAASFRQRAACSARATRSRYATQYESRSDAAWTGVARAGERRTCFAWSAEWGSTGSSAHSCRRASCPSAVLCARRVGCGPCSRALRWVMSFPTTP